MKYRIYCPDTNNYVSDYLNPKECWDLFATTPQVKLSMARYTFNLIKDNPKGIISEGEVISIINI